MIFNNEQYQIKVYVLNITSIGQFGVSKCHPKVRFRFKNISTPMYMVKKNDFIEFSLSVLSDCNQNDQSKPITDTK